MNEALKSHEPLMAAYDLKGRLPEVWTSVYESVGAGYRSEIANKMQTAFGPILSF